MNHAQSSTSNSETPIPATLDGMITRVLIDERAIADRIAILALEITEFFRGKPLTVVAVLNGSLLFAADLLRRVPLPLKLDCLSVASYHGATESSGMVAFSQPVLPEVRGRHVLLLDDILDTGRTLHAVRERLLAEAGPAEVRIAVLLSKRKQRAMPVVADYVAFEIEDEFVVGYGLDYQGQYRNLPVIGVLRHPAAATPCCKSPRK